ncbi:tryptophan--tRNA ligase [Oxyplasma meridianum]|uniref:Tryptophan--tRNA ligase n=1 Tax=Oxyplasma meridianum TaxID=3073602 RepID=A0AAX4NDX9_9ARCH
MADDHEITPWEVSNTFQEAQYEKIAKEFGAKIIDEGLREEIKYLAGEVHRFIQYDIFFAHRDLDQLLDGYKKGRKFYLYTGRGPSGKMHLGHLIPFMFTKWLQDRFDVDLIIQITDDEKYIFRDTSEADLKKYTQNNILDILSLGFKPEKTHVMIDSDNSNLLYNYGIRVAKHITASTVKSVFGLKDSDNIGKFFFTSIQSVPAFIVSAITGHNVPCLIPYAIDQDPHFKISRDILPKLGYEKPASIISKFIPSLKGSGKMSSSDETSGIYLDDDNKTIKRKLMKYAFSGGRDTMEEQRRLGANPDIDFAFNTYRMLEPDMTKVSKIYEEYRSGHILSGEMKMLAYEKITEFLETLNSRRDAVLKNMDDYRFNPERFL